jgi:hypothetical protein
MVRFREQAGSAPRPVKLSAAFERLRYPGNRLDSFGSIW